MTTESDIIRRTPPHDIEAEQAVFGGIFSRPREMDGLVELLNSDDFYAPQHAVLWGTLKDMHRAGKPISLTSTAVCLRESGALESVGGAVYLADLAQAVVTGANAAWYAERVRELAAKRKIIDHCMNIAGECYAPAVEAASLLDMMGDVSSKTLLCGAVGRHVGEVALDVLESLKQGKAARPMPTPWGSLNAVLKGGMVPGELVVLAARPGLGKTALAGCIAIETARSGVPVLFVSREVRDETLVSRFLAREGRIDARLFRQGIEHAQNAMDDVRGAVNSIMGLPLTILEKSTVPLTPGEIRRVCRTIKGGVGLVVIDYLQLVTPDQSHRGSREREVAEMSRSFKQLALDLRCPVLLLSQLNRAAEDSDRVPGLHDLRESGAIEQDADIVMFLHTKKVQRSLVKAPVQVEVAKGRSSGTGAAYLVFDKPYADFYVDEHAEKWREPQKRAGNEL